ncbi:MAG: hypothetical protein ACRCV0_03070 [Brevinema sp.]
MNIVRLILCFILFNTMIFAQSKNWIDEKKMVIDIIDEFEQRRLKIPTLPTGPNSPDFSLQDAFDRIASNRNLDNSVKEKKSHLKDAEKWFYRQSVVETGKEFFMIYPNAVIFKSSHGSFLFNIVFKKDTTFIKPVLESELLVMVTPKNPLMPHYMFQSSIKITIVGENYLSRWTNQFFYDQREIQQQNTYTQKHLLKLFKSLSNDDVIRIRDIFQHNTKITVVIEGLLGLFRFQLHKNQILFYNKFFEQAKKEGFYTEEVYYEKITR